MCRSRTQSQSHTRAGPSTLLVSRAGGQGLHNARGTAGNRSHASSSFVLWGLSHGLPEVFLKWEDWQPLWGQSRPHKGKALSQEPGDAAVRQGAPAPGREWLPVHPSSEDPPPRRQDRLTALSCF